MQQKITKDSSIYKSNELNLKSAKLILASGEVFCGMSPAWQEDIVFGEVVFNTGMTGYEETLTDPSYSGQILAFTYPILGNYGVSQGSNWESSKIQVQGVICQTVFNDPKHYSSIKTFLQWLYVEKIPILIGVDTRALTKAVRDEGVISGAFVFNSKSEAEVFRLGGSFPNTTAKAVSKVSSKSTEVYGTGKYRIILVDCGNKKNILTQLLKFDVTIKVVPFDYDYITHEACNYDGIFLSNGPGDPKDCIQTIEILKKILNDKRILPVYGICLGSQLMGLSAGADTYKLKFGHRGQNQPCIELSTNKCYLTSQNHGYAIKQDTLPQDWVVTFKHLNDNTIAGIRHKNKPFVSVQFHPEASPGPHDSYEFFEQFFAHVVSYSKEHIQPDLSLFTIAKTPNNINLKNDNSAKPLDLKKDNSFDRSLINNVLILGSGGLRVGQAGEFDYSGSQAIKAFKQDRVRTVLVNPNIATVQTDKTMADEIYFQPLDATIVTEIIKKENIDSIALGFGGQTALNLGLELYKSGVLNKYNVKVLGSSVDTIDKTEDRGIFRDTLQANNIKTPVSYLALSLEEAKKYALDIGYPLMIRSGFSLGGLGSSKVDNEVELVSKVGQALSGSPQVLIEEYLTGWKEYEYEIVRDMDGNTLTICNMENLDPMGIHTGESIVIAPAQTLNDSEHQFLRNIAIRCAHIFNIIGECNIQFSINPANGDYRVIEMNPRLSRSSALASKATGYPLAYIATKLCLGYSLYQLSNCITQKTTAFFEPALDYVVVKIPRWDTHKLKLAERNIGTEMKSVGEAMGIGRSFPEALQKAIQALNIGATGIYDYPWRIHNLRHEIEFATDRRIFALFNWFMEYPEQISEVQELSKIDWWFLVQIQEIAKIVREIESCRNINNLGAELLRKAKQFGFSDAYLAKILQVEKNNPDKLRMLRKKFNIHPVIKQIDTTAGEFIAQTNYLYLTYHGETNDIAVAGAKDSICILGSGPYSIGSSVEFDWCTVNIARQLRLYQKQAILINSNPETVSTDYDESDRLYFEPLILERVQDILDFERPSGVCVSVGGQVANNLALPLYKAGYTILGTSPLDIDRAENRESFSQLLTTKNIDQPKWIKATGQKDAEEFINAVGLPVLIRPSYVLSGSAMKVVYDKNTLIDYLNEAFLISKDHPVVISEFIENAKELEVDGVAYKGKILIHAISEHVENAGIHSGDATIIFPPERLYLKTVLKAKDIADHIVSGLGISGPFNMQLIAKNNEIKVIECNVRSSRSFPFISKVTGQDLIQITAQVLLDNPPIQKFNTLETKCIGIKSPVFSYNRFKGSDPIAQVEMSSTGEVACIGEDILQTFYMSWLATGFKLNGKKILLSVHDRFKDKLLPILKQLFINGWEFVATEGTHNLLVENGIQSRCVFKVSQQIKPNLQHTILNKEVDLIVNLPFDVQSQNNTNTQKTSDGFIIRRLAIDYHIPLITNFHLAEMLLESLSLYYGVVPQVKSYREYTGSF